MTCILRLALCLAVSSATLAQGGVEEEARAALEAGEGARAAEAYQVLLDERGPSAALYFNQGLAFAQAERFGEAVLAFERSLSLEPDEEDAELALAATRRALREQMLSASVDLELTQGETERISRWRFFHAWDPGVVSWVLLIAWLAGFGAIAARRRASHPAARDGLAVFAVLSLLTALGMGGYAAGQWWTRDVRPAIVLEESGGLYESPTKMSASTQPDNLYGGALVEIVSAREGWLQVELMDGSRGWLQSDAVGDIRVERWSEAAPR